MRSGISSVFVSGEQANELETEKLLQSRNWAESESWEDVYQKDLTYPTGTAARHERNVSINCDETMMAMTHGIHDLYMVWAGEMMAVGISEK